jgi:hypothetical protein
VTSIPALRATREIRLGSMYHFDLSLRCFIGCCAFVFSLQMAKTLPMVRSATKRAAHVQTKLRTCLSGPWQTGRPRRKCNSAHEPSSLRIPASNSEAVMKEVRGRYPSANPATFCPPFKTRRLARLGPSALVKIQHDPRKRDVSTRSRPA